MSINSLPRLVGSALPPVAHRPALNLDHDVQFYAEDEYLLEELGRFIAAALVSGDVAIVIATKAHREGLAEQLKARGVNPTRAIEQGRYFSLDAAETLAKFMVGNWPNEALFTNVMDTVLGTAAMAMDGQCHRICAFGEMVALLWEQGNKEAALRLEQLWNIAARKYPLSLRCAYPMRNFGREDHGELFLKICSEHAHVVPAESYTALINDEQRMRNISYLQQKAHALESEIGERKRVEDALRCAKTDMESQVEQRTAALRQLSSRLLRLQDAERRRNARELHDSLGQYLVGLKLNVDILRQSPNHEELWTKVEALMERCISEVRTLSYLLHPPTMDAAGLASAARWYVEGFGQHSSIQVTLNISGDLGRLPDAIEMALFRVLQEALTNVHRHSGATTADILLMAEGRQVILEIRDNGHGMPYDVLDRFHATGGAVGLGLAGIGERVRELGGKLKLESNGDGTVLRVAIPGTQLVSK
jgi:signal transduction histidine kinase